MLCRRGHKTGVEVYYPERNLQYYPRNQLPELANDTYAVNIYFVVLPSYRVNWGRIKRMVASDRLCLPIGEVVWEY